MNLTELVDKAQSLQLQIDEGNNVETLSKELEEIIDQIYKIIDDDTTNWVIVSEKELEELNNKEID